MKQHGVTGSTSHLRGIISDLLPGIIRDLVKVEATIVTNGTFFFLVPHLLTPEYINQPLVDVDAHLVVKYQRGAIFSFRVVCNNHPAARLDVVVIKSALKSIRYKIQTQLLLNSKNGLTQH